MMEESLIALLNHNLRVIIPDFGAFIIRQKQPRIVVFNEFLRYNDGLLIEHIVKTEGIDREIAEQRVADFAEENGRRLQGGKEVVLPGLGKLFKDATGKIGFAESPDADFTPAPEPVKPLAYSPEEDIPVKEEEKKQVVRAVRKKAASPGTRAPRTVPKKKPAREKPVREVTVTHAEEPLVPVTPVPPTPVTPVPPTPLAPVPPAPVNPVPTVPVAHIPPAPVADTAPGKPGWLLAQFRTNQVLAWVGVFLLVNAIILALFTLNDRFREARRKKAGHFTLTDPVRERLSDSVRAAAQDTELVSSPSVIDPGPQTALVNPSISRYYIVAGCFRDETNADALVSTLKGLGYKAEKFGRIGNLYAVCYASFDDKDEAVQELKRIRKRVPDTWMTRF